MGQTPTSGIPNLKCDVKDLKTFYFNCGGMRNKCKDLFVKVKSTQYNVLIFTETWLNNTFFNSEIFGDDWLVYRRDRDYKATNTTRGGGVLIAVHKSISSEEIAVTQGHSSEQVWVKISGNDSSVVLGVYYVSPNDNDNMYDDILSNAQHIRTLLGEKDVMFLFGDFNRPDLVYISDEVTIGYFTLQI